MITTVCMNPSFDKTASVSKLVPGDVNRLQDVRIDVGGKGINVAIVLKRLGIPVSCVGCLGEENSIAFLHLIRREDVPFEYLAVPGEVRTNLKLLDREQKLITEFNEPGVIMNASQLDSFIALLRERASESEYVVLSGRLPAGCPENTYQLCMQQIHEKKWVLDAAGESLLHGIKEKPFLVKPNLPEIEALMKK